MADRNRSGQGRELIKCYLRCYFAGACFNARGYYSVGLAYAMDPGLAVIHRDPDALREARQRYVGHFNTHLFWLPCLVAIFLSAERHVASGHMPARMIERLKDTAAYTLSGIGDSVFAGSLLIFWALSSICLLLAGHFLLPLLLGIGFFLGLQCFRIYTFWAGHRLGLAFLERLRRWDLINWGQRIKLLNGGLLLGIWILAWPRPMLWTAWTGVALSMALFARGLHYRNIPREIVLVAFLAAMWGLPWIVNSVRQLF
ncbi:PTS system, mannose-specific IID component [Paucidesulfovibrio gracilis DSM 16080]|uniref:PTS system, mannose-specific IID component n=1 Tax=Paucidesulfovibrio gracilis DSM 16080 TaxID=1121449 RepID=A0A1T4XL59_9BACT|nr:PTS system mannose/fructose/sorbose family transporter subunit IID [Paucidesulfovibrio gracilis]SKA90302.1 PTS system, mannose-specific IID component [Paucidesulfovibrio gracilis DSM 16080]